MALLDNSIGDFTFLGLTGSRQPPRTILSLDERPGVAGTEVTDEGIKGRPFMLMSWVDCEDFAAAEATYIEYLALIGQDSVSMVQGGVASETEGYSIKVLNVRKLYSGTIVPGPGGLNPPSQAILECEWELLAIPT